MYVKNYTSVVPAEKTMQTIESLLRGAHATSFVKLLDKGVVRGIVFTIQSELETPITVRLPVDEDGVYTALLQQKKDSHWWPATKKEKVREQAKRTAWKLMEDWLRVQLSLVSMKQAQLAQVFLPYLWNGKQSLYEHWVADPDRMLPPRQDDERPAVAGRIESA